MIILKSHLLVFRSNSELFEDPWEVLFDDISLHRIIGEGAFGKVYSGMLLKQTVEVYRTGRKPLQRKTDKRQQQIKMGITVAVKMLQSMIWLCQGFITYKYIDKVLQTTFQILMWAK